MADNSIEWSPSEEHRIAEAGASAGFSPSIAAGPSIKTTATKGTLFVGTSGWSNLTWGKGVLPRAVPQRERLARLSGIFNAVEVNSSFYRLPPPGCAARWASAVPPGFRFAVKLSRFITHIQKLRMDSADPGLSSFLETIADLGDKRGPLLVQLPPNLRKDAALLDEFLKKLHAAMPSSPWRIAVELRHPSWRSDEITKILDRHAAALVVADMPACTVSEPNRGAPFVYIRRHGPAGDYKGGYAPERIAEDAALVERELGSGRDVFVFYNNTIDPDAAENALALLQTQGAVAPGALG
jgi:uncharacterized protein YecE (DUF72 family)